MAMRVLHVFRSPVGGLFRHVNDLARSQQALGHEVGILCDSSTGGEAAAKTLESLGKTCSLGVHRRPIPTLPGWGDVAGTRATVQLAKSINADVIHGHGAKGGVFARLAARKLKRPGVYTPHGGALHYDWLKPPGAAFLAAERALRLKGTGLVFVCEFERQLYDRKIGLGGNPSNVVYNGLWPEEFAPRQLAADASDLLFVGEMRQLKGVDVLLQAVAALPAATRPSLTLVGEGRDKAAFETLARDLALGTAARFAGRKNMAEAITLGRTLVLPSRHESFPYVVLEAVGAQVPVIASAVGGIGEILPPDCLVPAGDIQALAAKLQGLATAGQAAQALAASLQAKARERFSVATMAAAVTAFYGSIS
ncbi:MAG: glycosyltransferase family 4 protein [Alphaproteobacteria bacterium]|nr:glycosyltransferase family 4 protein [Alphaproteobacteria bacterium]